jgi:type I restriction enzyme S subunit
MCRRIFNQETKNIGAIPFYKIGTFGGEPDAYISKELYEQYKEKYPFPKNGDILISAAGTIGRTVIYNGKPSYFQDSNIVWIDNNEKQLANRFLFYLYKIIKWNTEGGTIQRLYNNILYNSLIPVPAKQEQTAIAEALSDIDSLITEQEKLIAKKKATKQGAMQELLRPKEGWESAIFKNLCVCSSERINPASTQEVYKCIELEHISQGTGMLLGYTYTDTLKSQKTVFQKGDVLFGKLRPYLKKFVFCDFDGVCSTEIWVLKANIQKIDKKYLFYLIQTNIFIENANKSEGTKMPRSEWKNISAVNYSYPPLPEQKRIAVILSDMDTEIEQLEKTFFKYQQIKQGMMNDLLTGKVRLL